MSREQAPARTLAAALFAAVLGLGNAQADIVQPVDGHGTCLCNPVPGFGQSFTAVDSTVDTISAFVADWNQFLGASFALTFDLFSGAGFGGASIVSIADVLPDGFGGVNGDGDWWDFDIGATALVLGNTYTFRVTPTGASTRGGVFRSDADVYGGGIGYFADGSPTGGDLKFRVLGVTADVPEPATGALVVMALAGLGIRRRREASL